MTIVILILSACQDAAMEVNVLIFLNAMINVIKTQIVLGLPDVVVKGIALTK